MRPRNNSKGDQDTVKARLNSTAPCSSGLDMTSFAFQPHQPKNEGALNNNAPLVEPAGRFIQLIVNLETNAAT
ncbi:MAG TPA: hypothetical protein VL137_06610 [Polyangiaceae bacterium]|nr:hypothetical protein [Polyangiaceae bacterium]